MAETLRNYCWSCGGQNGYHYPDCDNPVSSSVKPPSKILPRCGKKSSFSGPPVIHYDQLPVKTEPELHYCCNCGKPLLVTFAQWLSGPCPHCGAKGS